MRRLTFSVLLAVAALLVLAGGVVAAQNRFRGPMRPDRIVPLPAKVNSNANGHAVFKLSEDGNSISYRLRVANIDEVTQAHIHRFVKDGRNGPVLVWLYPGPNSTSPGAPTEEIDGVLADGSFGPQNLRGGVTWDELVELMRNGRVYVNVHTVQAPGGEINGHVH